MFHRPDSFVMEHPLLLTGAAGGLGRALSVEAARRGWPLILTDRPGSELGDLAQALSRSYGVSVQVAFCDLRDSVERARLFTEIAESTPALGGLVNVAGVEVEGTFATLAPADIQDIVRVNVEATLDVTHRALALRPSEARFLLVTVSSLAAFYPMPVKATYAASKRFLLDFFRALREEVRGEPVAVTVLCPAGMPTTPSAIEAMGRQGVWGRLTSMQPGRVAADTFDGAVQGRFLVIPGLPNRLLKLLSAGLPAQMLAAVVARRWGADRGAAYP